MGDEVVNLFMGFDWSRFMVVDMYLFAYFLFGLILSSRFNLDCRCYFLGFKWYHSDRVCGLHGLLIQSWNLFFYQLEAFNFPCSSSIWKSFQVTFNLVCVLVSQVRAG